MIEQFKDSIRWMADAAVGAPDCEPPHMHVDEFLDPERWTDEQIVLLLRAVKTIQVVGKCPIVAIEEIQLPCGTPVPDSLVAIADLWRGIQETPPAIYIMNERDVPSGGAVLLLPRATQEFSERCGPVAAYLIAWYRRGEGYLWQIVLACGRGEDVG